MRIGIDLGGTKIESIALDPNGTVLDRQRVRSPRDDYGATVRTVVGLIEACENRLARHGSVGIGIPGALSAASGLIKNANSTWLLDQALDVDLATILQRPIRLANDANCFALSEAVDGAAADAGVVFGVILGTGTGAGIVVNGRLLTGPNAIAGEWGHNPLPWPRDDERPGPDCYCGRQGCLETFLSGPALAAEYLRQGGENRIPTEIAAAAEQDEPIARRVLDRYVDRLARGLAQVINILDPDVIVLGGGMSAIDYLYEAVPVCWNRHVFSDRVDTELLPPKHGDASGVRGAAWLWPISH